MIAGFIDPDNYLGGRVTLKPERVGARSIETLRRAASAGPPRRRPRRSRPDGRQHGQRGARGQRRQGPRPARLPVPRLRRHAAAVRARDRRAAGISTIVHPAEQLGVLRARPARRRLRARNDQGVGWDPSMPTASPVKRDRASRWSRTRAQMEREGFAAIGSRSSAARDVTRFQGQAYELSCRCPAGRSTADDRAGAVRGVPAHLRAAPTARARPGRACRRCCQPQRHRDRRPRSVRDLRRAARGRPRPPAAPSGGATVFLSEGARVASRSRSTTARASPPGCGSRAGDHRRARHDDLRPARAGGAERDQLQLRPGAGCA